MKILFSTTYIPYKKAKLFEDTIDYFYYRNTLRQGIFQLKQMQSWHSLHLIAQNLPVYSVVLENPGFKKFKREISLNNYDAVALSFTIIGAVKLLKMVEWLKETYPQIDVIIGGYGTALFSENHGLEKQIKAKVDYICFGEGVSFMRTYLRDKFKIESLKPLTQDLLPIDMRFFRSKITINRTLNFISTLGCRYKCSFCGTSQQFKQEIVLFSMPDLYNSIKECTRKYKKARSGVIFKEDFLADKTQVVEFIKLMENDTELINRPFLLTVFSSAKSISQYTLSELIRCGIGMIYIGVESFNSTILETEQLYKRGKDLINIKSLFDDLSSAGIHTLGSIITGWDDQTREMAENELQQFVYLNPTMYQVMPLQAIPGTRLWERMKLENRIIPDFNYDHLRLDRSSFTYKHFTQDESVSMIYKTYKKLVDYGGPWPFRMFVNLRKGIKTMKNTDGTEFKQRMKAYQKMIFPLYVLSIISGLFFGGVQFRKTWRYEMASSFIDNPFIFLFAATLALIAIPLLLLIEISATLRHSLLKNGDQPETIRVVYKNQ
jgi:radical SAM superfamily enzyme YgiQ (UPF0313 family)